MHGWRSGTPLIDALAAEPWRFDVHQAARILEAAKPGAPAVGAGESPAAEALRFTGEVGFGFPPSQISAAGPDPRDPTRLALSVTFMGLVGQGGPMPLAFTDLLRERIARRDTAMRDFLDIFVHRIVALLVRARRAHHPGLDGRGPEQSAFTAYMRALAGLNGRALRNRQAVPDGVPVGEAGLFNHMPRSMVGLERVVAGYLGAPVKGRPFVGRYLPLAPQDHSRLGRGGRNNRLGKGVVLGTRVWLQDDGIGLDIGPLSFAAFRRLLPDGPGNAGLVDLIRLYLVDQTDVSLRLRLMASERPAARLGGGTRLGWTSWLSPRPGDGQGDGSVSLVPRLLERKNVKAGAA